MLSTLSDPADAAEKLCHWVQNYRGAQEETHWAFHFDNPCPYAVVAAVLRGQPDPRAVHNTAVYGENTVHRPTWDETWLGIARVVAARAACTRSQVGAILVVDNRHTWLGYNGVPAGEIHCTDGG